MAFDIETLDDVIAANSCCCAPVLCPVPVRECESSSGSVAVDLLFPFAEPSGVPTAEVPTLYESFSSDVESLHNGTQVIYYSHDFSPPTNAGYENFKINTATATSEADQAYSGHEVQSSSDGTTCTPSDTPTSGGFFSPSYDTEEDFCNRTETTQAVGTLYTHTPVGPEPTPTGCPGPFPEIPTTEWGDYSLTLQTLQTLTGTKTKADLQSEAIVDIPGTWLGSGCSSSLSFASGAFQANPRWPIESDNYDGAAWPACGDGPFTVPAWSFATKARITYRVPHEWTDPISGLTVPFPGTYFKITYDVLFTPAVGSPSFDSEDNVIDWTTGPGTGDADDPSWVIGTVTLDPPSEPGTLEIVNVRFTCRDEGMFADVPQVTGTAYP